MTTQFAKASYQEIIDLHTESDKVSVIGIHTPTSSTPRKMFGGFFDQFKKFKYLGCSISLVPAARLPADPLQVSYEAGDLTIDPRDMLNPIMFHGCHGNDMGVILNRFYALNSVQDGTKKYSDSIFQVEAATEPGSSTEVPDFLFGDQLENLYYKALTDNTWKKAHPQRGFRKSGLRPLVYSMATNMQFNGILSQSGVGIPDPLLDIEYSEENLRMDIDMPVTQASRRFFTPRLTGLGWLDTRNVLTVATKPFGTRSGTGESFDIDAILNAGSVDQESASAADLPLVYMGMILMPPAYKTEQYFRMIINHHFAFKDFRGISLNVLPAETPAYSNFNDENYEPPEPGPEPVDTRLVSIRRPALNPSSTAYAVWSLGYVDPVTQDTVIIDTDIMEEPDKNIHIYGPYSIPIGATVIGTKFRNGAGGRIYSKMVSSASTATPKQWTVDGVTYYANPPSVEVVTLEEQPNPLGVMLT